MRNKYKGRIHKDIYELQNEIKKYKEVKIKDKERILKIAQKYYKDKAQIRIFTVGYNYAKGEKYE